MQATGYIYSVIIKESDSSFLTALKKSQERHERRFMAAVPCTSPLQKVPAITQHMRPPFVPLLLPSCACEVEAGHMPSSSTLFPPGCLPHFLNSQQFIFPSMNLISLHVLLSDLKHQFNQSGPSHIEKYVSTGNKKPKTPRFIIECFGLPVDWSDQIAFKT
jgi:hypothetical protein